MSTRSADGDSRENTPELDGSPGSRRTSKKRKVLSCYACRNRKMKCDRVYPVCGRCQKTGRADQCTYDPRLLEDLTGENGIRMAIHTAPSAQQGTENQEYAVGDTSLEALRWKARAQDRRIEELERKLVVKDDSSKPSHFLDVTPAETVHKEEIMFRGKGFKTQFHGSTSVMSTIAQVYSNLLASIAHSSRSLVSRASSFHARSFIDRSFYHAREIRSVHHLAIKSEAMLTNPRTDFKTFRDRRKIAMKGLENSIRGTDEDILAALPERNYANQQVALYFATWETTYRIIHEPSFWKEYSTFWDQPIKSPSNAGFIVIILLIVAIAKCIAPKEDVFVGDTTADRSAASDVIKLCDAWMGRQPRKRLTLQFFQIQCLALFAKRVNCVQLKQDWVVSGDLVRLAIASGMHRDPGLLSTGKISGLEKEMKKRLWVTIMELELQSSIETGLPSSLTALHWDTPGPANLPDDTFSTDTRELPASRPLEHFTPASYLCISRQSIPFRLHLMQLINDPTEKLSYEEVLRYDAQIHELLSRLPKWGDARAATPSALLKLQLHQFLLLLHKPFANLAPKNARYIYSLTTSINTADSMVTSHDELVSRGTLALHHLRNDIVRIGLTLSQIVYHNCTLVAPIKPSVPPAQFAETHFADPDAHIADHPLASKFNPGVEVSLALLPQNSFLARTLCTTAIDILENVAQLYERKVLRLGTGYMEHWLMCAAIGMLPLPSSSKPPATSIAHITCATDDIQARSRKTLDRFQHMAFRVLALQQDPQGSLAESLRDTMARVTPEDGRTIGSVGGGLYVGVGVKDGVSAGGFENLGDGQVDLEGWNFPDFWAFDFGGEF